MTRDDLDASLAALDRALADRQDIVYDDLAEAVRRVVALRDGLIEDRRRGHAVADRLERVNAILSLVVASEYPLEGSRRERIECARRELESVFA